MGNLPKGGISLMEMSTKQLRAELQSCMSRVKCLNGHFKFPKQ